MLAVASNKANLQLLEEFLATADVPVDAVSDPSEIQARPDPDDPPPFAMVDVDGLGAEVWELVDRLNAADVPVVVLTQYRTEEIQKAMLKHPVRTVLEKPVRKAQLKAIVETLAR